MTSSEYKAGLWESQHLYYLRILIFEADHTEVNHWLWNSWKPTVWIARAEHRADPSCTGLQMASGRPHWNPDRVIIIPWFRSLNRGYHSTIFNVVITLHRPPCCHSWAQSLSKVAQFIFFDIWNPDRVIIIPWFRSLNRGYHSTIFNVVITLHRPPQPCCHSGTQSLSKVAQFIFLTFGTIPMAWRLKAAGTLHELFGWSAVLRIRNVKKLAFLKKILTSLMFSSEITLLLSAAWVLLQSKESMFQRIFFKRSHLMKKENSQNTVSAKKFVKLTGFFQWDEKR